MPDARPRDILSLHAAARPEKPAVVEDRPDGCRLRGTYAELNQRVTRLAPRMLALGVRARDRVIWCGMNSPEVVAMTHAARKIRATAVPLNYRLAAAGGAYGAAHPAAVV